jgi:hypothetical protein
MKKLLIIICIMFSFGTLQAQGLMSNQANSGRNTSLKAYHAKQRKMEKNCFLCEKNWSKKKAKRKEKEMKQLAKREEL